MAQYCACFSAPQVGTGVPCLPGGPSRHRASVSRRFPVKGQGYVAPRAKRLIQGDIPRRLKKGILRKCPSIREQALRLPVSALRRRGQLRQQGIEGCRMSAAQCALQQGGQRRLWGRQSGQQRQSIVTIGGQQCAQRTIGCRIRGGLCGCKEQLHRQIVFTLVQGFEFDFRNAGKHRVRADPVRAQQAFTRETLTGGEQRLCQPLQRSGTQCRIACAQRLLPQFNRAGRFPFARGCLHRLAQGSFIDHCGMHWRRGDVRYELRTRGFNPTLQGTQGVLSQQVQRLRPVTRCNPRGKQFVVGKVFSGAGPLQGQLHVVCQRAQFDGARVRRHQPIHRSHPADRGDLPEPVGPSAQSRQPVISWNGSKIACTRAQAVIGECRHARQECADSAISMPYFNACGVSVGRHQGTHAQRVGDGRQFVARCRVGEAVKQGG